MNLQFLVAVFVLMLISLFSTFKVAESHWRSGFWPDMLGHVMTAIGSFWMAIIFWLKFTVPNYHAASQDEASMFMCTGLALVMWSATCYRLKRRRTDTGPLIQFRDRRVDDTGYHTRLGDD